MQLFTREYNNEENLKQDVNFLQGKGVNRDDVYVLAHDSDRTDRIAASAGINTIGMKEMDIGSAVGNLFNNEGDQLRTKLQELGMTEAEANNYEGELDEGKVLLMITNHENIDRYFLSN